MVQNFKIHQNSVNVLILYLIDPSPGRSILQPLLQAISQVTVLAPPAMVQELAFLVALPDLGATIVPETSSKQPTSPGLAEPQRIEPQRMCHRQRWLHSMACQVPRWSLCLPHVFVESLRILLSEQIPPDQHLDCAVLLSGLWEKVDCGCLKTIKHTLKARNPRKVFADPGAEKAYSRYTTSTSM